ncbi:class I SAM-dependent methyltransferase [Patescibacteria group bacterium]
MNYKKDIKSIGGWLTKKEGEFLFNTAKSLSSKDKIIEIGSWKGRSTTCLGLGVKEGGKSKIFAIDPYTDFTEKFKVLTKEDTYQKFLSNIKKAKIDKFITSIKKTSSKAFKTFEKKYGFNNIKLILVDGGHTFNLVKIDHKLWFPKLENNRLIAFHDSWFHFGVQLYTAIILITSKEVRNPRLIDTMTVMEKVKINTLNDRINNILFVIYRLLVGWIGVFKINFFGGLPFD